MTESRLMDVRDGLNRVLGPRPMEAGRSLVWSLSLSVSLVVLLCLIASPYWRTNDDIAMMFSAHGFGTSAYGTPKIVFSNVLWGHFVRLLPGFAGITGYAMAAYLTLTAAGAGLAYGLLRLGWGLGISAVVLTFLMVQPILSPQFTITAGMATAGGVVLWMVFACHEQRSALVAGCALVFMGFLIRWHECVFVLIVAMPLLPHRSLVRNVWAKAVLVGLIGAVALAAWCNRQAYAGPEWQAFRDFHLMRLPYTDLDAGKKLLDRPEILNRHGYSRNDIRLLRSWFFLDGQLAERTALSRMAKEVRQAVPIQDRLDSGMEGLTSLTAPVFRPMLLMGLVLGLVFPSRRVSLAWLLCLASFFALGYLGRPGVHRVYIAPISLLTIAPLLVYGTYRTHPADQNESLQSPLLPVVPQGARTALLAIAVLAIWFLNPYRQGLMLLLGILLLVTAPASSRVLRRQARPICIVLMLATTTLTCFNQFTRSWELAERAELVRREVWRFPKQVVVAWGGMPYCQLYPVFDVGPQARSLRIFGIGNLLNAPAQVSTVQRQNGRGFLERLREKSGVPLLSADPLLERLRIYCRQWHDAELRVLRTEKYGQFHVRWVRCIPETGMSDARLVEGDGSGQADS